MIVIWKDILSENGKGLFSVYLFQSIIFCVFFIQMIVIWKDILSENDKGLFSVYLFQSIIFFSFIAGASILEK